MNDDSSMLKTFIFLTYYIRVTNNLLQCRYMYGLCLDNGKHDTYVFLDPQLIYTLGKYITNQYLNEGTKANLLCSIYP